MVMMPGSMSVSWYIISGGVHHDLSMSFFVGISTSLVRVLLLLIWWGNLFLKQLRGIVHACVPTSILTLDVFEMNWFEMKDSKVHCQTVLCCIHF